MKRTLTIILFASFVTAHATTQLTVREAIAAAYKHRPNIQALEYRIREEKLKVKEAWTGYLPRVQLVTTYQRDNNSRFPIANNFGRDITTGIQAQQLIYQFGGPQQQAKIAQAGVGIAQFEKEIQEQALAYEVTKTFIDCWVLQEQKALFHQLDLSSKRTFNKAKQEKNAALLDAQEYFGAVEARALAHEQVVNFAHDAELVQAQLAFLVGNKYTINLVDDTAGDITHLTFTPPAQDEAEARPAITHYLDEARKKRPELQQMDKKIELEQQTVTLEKSATLPSINLVGSALHSGGYLPTQQGGYSAGISISWPIFDGTRTHYRMQEADARATAAMLQKEQVAQEVALQVTQSYRQLHKALTTHQTQRIALKRAELLFNRRTTELKIGLTTQTALEEARYGLAQAKNRWLLAQADVAQKEAFLAYRCGNLTYRATALNV